MKQTFDLVADSSDRGRAERGADAAAEALSAEIAGRVDSLYNRGKQLGGTRFVSCRGEGSFKMLLSSTRNMPLPMWDWAMSI